MTSNGILLTRVSLVLDREEETLAGTGRLAAAIAIRFLGCHGCATWWRVGIPSERVRRLMNSRRCELMPYFSREMLDMKSDVIRCCS